jgi:thymidylate synthase
MSDLHTKFRALIATLDAKFYSAPLVHASAWQSIKAPQPMAELFNESFTLDMENSPSRCEKIFKPNLPWANQHFKTERVSGDPINPGTTWRIWPYSNSADTHRREGEEDPQFDHSYAERYWPKFAGQTKGGILEETPEDSKVNMGIRFEYGDLNDLVDTLVSDPLTRQAYLPIWFPEDLGAIKVGKRVPCSLGYHFIMRNGKLHLIYYIRSCDYVRHFRDDVYLTALLQIWVLEQLKLADPNNWTEVEIGTFTMHITSLHMFESDQKLLKKRVDKTYD